MAPKRWASVGDAAASLAAPDNFLVHCKQTYLQHPLYSMMLSSSGSWVGGCGGERGSGESVGDGGGSGVGGARLRRGDRGARVGSGGAQGVQ